MSKDLLSERGLSLERLKSFCLVADCGGIARACDGDPSRQALISRQIRELEVFFGTELTRRKGKGIELTEAGRELARRVREQLLSLADFKAKSLDRTVEFRLASGASLLEWLIAPGLGEISKVVPAATFVLHDLRSADVVRGLTDHSLDYGVVRRSAVVQPLKFQSLGRMGYSLFVPVRWRKRRVDGLPMAVASGGEFLRDLARAAEKAKFTPSVLFQCTSFTQAAQLVRVGAAASVLPDIAATTLGRSAWRHDLPWLKGFDREIGLCWHERLAEVRPSSRELRGLLVAHLRAE